ncbi:uncharacterized protein LOC134816748 isoform X2 [Bolinopsis microptera]
MCMKNQQHDGILSQGREGALTLWKEGQCVRTSSVASTGFCRFALSDDQRHCFVGLDEKSKISCIVADKLNVVNTFQPSDYNQKGMCWSVAVRGNYVYLGYESGQIVLFDSRHLSKQVLEVKVHDEIVTALDVIDNKIISSSPDSTIKITSLITEGMVSEGTPSKEESTVSGDENALESIVNSLNPARTDQKYSAEVTHTVPLECKGSSHISIRGDGKLYAVSGWDGGLRLYSCKKNKLLGLVEAHNPETITDMMTYDNKIVCSGRDCKISFWTFY